MAAKQKRLLVWSARAEAALRRAETERRASLGRELLPREKSASSVVLWALESVGSPRPTIRERVREKVVQAHVYLEGDPVGEQHDAAVAMARLREIEAHPERLVRGEELGKLLDGLAEFPEPLVEYDDPRVAAKKARRG
jgi:hypothetical protein